LMVVCVGSAVAVVSDMRFLSCGGGVYPPKSHKTFKKR
jgi:hypothetical protein